MQIKETQRHGLEEQRLVCDGIARNAMGKQGAQWKCMVG